MTRTTQQFFDARPESVGQARSFTSEALTYWGLPDRAEDVRLCVSELATNALVPLPQSADAAEVDACLDAALVADRLLFGRARTR